MGINSRCVSVSLRLSSSPSRPVNSVCIVNWWHIFPFFFIDDQVIKCVKRDNATNIEMRYQELREAYEADSEKRGLPPF